MLQRKGIALAEPIRDVLARLESCIGEESYVHVGGTESSRTAIGVAAEIVVGGSDDVVSVVGEPFGRLAVPTRDPFKTIGEILAAHPERTLFGFVSFDACRFYAPYTKRSPYPSIHFVLPRLLVETNARSVELTFGADGKDLADAATRALARAEDRSTTRTPPPIVAEDPEDRRRYVGIVEEAIRSVRGSNLMKVIVSRSVETAGSLDPIASHTAVISTATFDRSFAFRVGTVCAVGASPAPLLHVSSSGEIETVALAGSRPRGKTPEEDERLGRELFTDAKEASEHALSAWLALQEISSVSRPGSAAIRDFMHVRKFAHIQHLAARVTGELDSGRAAHDALRAVFPPVTSTGVPKKEAIETIDRLESSPRGVYAGVVGSWAGSGAMDFSICLRTAVGYADRATIRAGAGIVPDSTPDYEWIESVNKMNTILKRIVLGSRSRNGA